jgi:DNA-binding winged helix-turn-helix (wHTH) protein/TolB-like protein
MAMQQFGPFQYDPDQRLLLRNGEIVPLVPKAIDTLHVLLERRGRMVEKSELMKLVWPDTTVEEVGLARNISILRKALGDEDRESPYIETIPRRGYRFAAPEPAPGSPPKAPRKWLAPAAALAGLAVLVYLIYWQFYTPSRYLPQRAGSAGLAVVPFESLSPQLASNGFARGLSEALVSDMYHVDGVRVLSPSTVRRHQRLGVSMGLMARLLGLDVLVEGTVQQSGDRLRITAQLVDVHTGLLIWADNYDYPARGPRAGRSAGGCGHRGAVGGAPGHPQHFKNCEVIPKPHSPPSRGTLASKGAVSMKLFSIVAAVALTTTLAHAQTIKAGTFHEPSVVVAFYRSPRWADVLKVKQAELAAAKKAGETQKVQELQGWGDAQQELAHRQLAGEAPITNILEALAPQLPELARKAGVALIAPSLPYADRTVQTVDVTDLLLDCLHADDRTRAIVRDLRNSKAPAGR